jgi:adenylate/guanylate cyclase family protein
MAVGGLPGTRADHIDAIADLAIGMISSVRDVEPTDEPPWRIRIGIHTGPAVAGVIGTRKFVYDVWGDTVNVASRLESTAEPNQIHVSEPVAAVLQARFVVEPRGVVELKGKGGARTFLLNGRRPTTESPDQRRPELPPQRPLGDSRPSGRHEPDLDDPVELGREIEEELLLRQPSVRDHLEDVPAALPDRQGLRHVLRTTTVRGVNVHLGRPRQVEWRSTPGVSDEIRGM